MKRKNRKSWRRSSTIYKTWNIGDLVTVADYCRDSGRLAIVTELPDTMYSGPNSCKIQWIDEEGLRAGPIASLLRNLVKISSDHEFQNG